MRLGVFDSGIGGKTIADRLQHDYPSAEIIYVDDREHVPYGSRSQAEIIKLTDTAVQPLIKAKCDVIVLACNTATAAAIDALRNMYPTQLFIGLEPMLKPASILTKTGIIAVCATPFTLSSQRYNELKRKYASNITVLEPDCSNWAYMIEHNSVEDMKIAEVVEQVCAADADVIVLACTHYHWIKDKMLKMVNGRAIIIDPSEAISKRVGKLLGSS